MPKKTTTKKKSPIKPAAHKSSSKPPAKKSPKRSVAVQQAASSESDKARQIVEQLSALSNEKMRAIHIKNGADQPLFGALMGDIRKLANKFKPDHELGLALWATGILDAQFMAALSIKAAKLSAQELEGLVKAATFPYLADWFHSYVTKEHADVDKLREKWMKSKDKMLLRAGWRLTAGRVVKNAAGLDLVGLLDRIEREMPKAVPEVQWTMNTCLAEIGIHHAEHRARALSIGEKLGIYRDYPVSKGCTSPFAPIWINAMVKRQSK